MPTLPSDAKELVGYEPYGVDANGLYVFCGFRFAGGESVNLHMNHLMLGQSIMYLQQVAKEAQQRRLKVDPTASHTEVRETQSNLVRQLDFELDVSGKSANLLCTTQAGIRNELQLPLDLLEGMAAHLPGLIAELKRLQGEQRH